MLLNREQKWIYFTKPNGRILNDHFVNQDTRTEQPNHNNREMENTQTISHSHFTKRHKTNLYSNKTFLKMKSKTGYVYLQAEEV